VAGSSVVGLPIASRCGMAGVILCLAGGLEESGYDSKATLPLNQWFYRNLG